MTVDCRLRRAHLIARCHDYTPTLPIVPFPNDLFPRIDPPLEPSDDLRPPLGDIIRRYLVPIVYFTKVLIWIHHVVAVPPRAPSLIQPVALLEIPAVGPGEERVQPSPQGPQERCVEYLLGESERFKWNDIVFRQQRQVQPFLPLSPGLGVSAVVSLVFGHVRWISMFLRP